MLIDPSFQMMKRTLPQHPSSVNARFSLDGTNAFTVRHEAIVATPPTNIHAGAVTGLPQAFYRIERQR